jgi:signal transduction histidine kinase/CheY-like chemotaxis protein
VAGVSTLALFTLAAAAVVTLLVRCRSIGERLVQSRQSYRALVDELPLVTYAQRVDESRIVYVSPQVEGLLELTVGQALAEQDFWLARLHPLDRARVLREWRGWRADPAVGPLRRTYRMRTESGRVIWVDEMTVLVPERAGLPARFQRHLLDVSARRALEEQLREAQKFQALGRLAGGVAHDFNNLLAVIVGYAERLAAALPAGAHHEGAVAIGAAADRGTALVRQLLSFSRPEPDHRRLIDLNAVVARFIPMLRRVIGEDVDLELAFERLPLWVDVDPARFDQVLMNLVVNARDAMPSGGRLTITTAATDVDRIADDGGVGFPTAVVTVSDTGAGMDEATRERIFEPFFTTKQDGKGSGLGLATAYGIVDQAGGSLDVSSAPGHGTTFRIELPLVTSEPPPAAERLPEPALPRRGAETVLLVEDEAALRELQQITLEDAGYEVRTASDAAEALELAARHPFDLLITDVVMPGLSGPQLVEELRARGCDLPAIFVSGYGADEFSSRGVHLASGPVVQKPFPAETLLTKVRDVLDGATGAAGTVPPAAGYLPLRSINSIR